MGVGVVGRFGCPESAVRPADQGLIESTAVDRYDFSVFFSGACAMILDRRGFHELKVAWSGWAAVARDRRSCSGARQGGGRRANVNESPVVALWRRWGNVEGT